MQINKRDIFAIGYIFSNLENIIDEYDIDFLDEIKEVGKNLIEISKNDKIKDNSLYNFEVFFKFLEIKVRNELDILKQIKKIDET